MATTVDTVRTVFEAQFKGQGAIQAFRNELGLVGKLSDKVFGSSGSVKRGGATITDFNRAIDTQKLSLYTNKMNELAKEVAKNPKGFQDAEKALAKYAEEIGHVPAATAPATGGLRGLAGSIGPVGIAAGAAVAGVAALGIALAKLYPVAKEGAGLAQLEMSFERLNASVLNSPHLLTDMQKAAQGTITTFSAMEGFLTLTAGASDASSQAFAKAAPKLTEIAKAANVLNPTLGDTNFMFNSLARGIKRSEVRLLDNLGLNIKVADANKKWAKEMGVSVMAMSAQDKQMALLNETLLVGQNLIDQVGGDLSALTDPFERLTTATAEFTAEWKIAIANLYPAGGVEGLGKLVDQAAQQMKAQRALNDALKAGTIAQAEYNKLEEQRFYGQKSAVAILNEVAELTQAQADADKELAAAQEIVIAAYVGRARAEGLLFSPEVPQVEDEPTFVRDWIAPDAFDNTTQGAEDFARAERGVGDAAKYAAAGVAILDGKLSDLQMIADEGNAEVMKKYMEDLAKHTARTGDLMRDFSGDETLYTTTIDNIGDAWISVGGRTKEQNELLEEFQSAQGKANDVISDYTSGLKGYGEEQDKINKKMEDAAGKAAYYGEKISELEGIQGELSQVHQGAVWDTEKLEEALLNANAAAGAGAADYALLKIAVGDWSEKQATAAIKAGAMAGAIEDIAAGGMPAAQQLEQMTTWAQNLADVDLGPLFEDLTGGELIEGQLGELGDKIAQKAVQDGTPAEKIFADLETVATEKATAAKDAILAQIFPGGPNMPDMLPYEIKLSNLGDIEGILAELEKPREILYNIVVQGSVPDAPAPSQGYTGPNRAGGGPVSANTAYIVGERGPELFVPNQSGTIEPNVGAKNITMNNNIVLSESALESRRSELMFQIDDVLNEAAVASGF